MDLRTDTSSNHLTAPWAMPAAPSHHAYQSSSPSPSLSLRRDPNESSLSQRDTIFYPFSSLRSSPRRLRPTTSIASHKPTLPSQPVIVRVHSADASSHLNPKPRPPRTGHSMSKKNELPPVSDFSIDGILAAIQPEIEGTIDAIAEIMGRSRLALANEYDSHMPPQGEIRASSRPPLLPVEEASSSNERLAADDVFIVGDEASLVEGSHSGSAAYGLLERLRAAPRPRRQRSEASVSRTTEVSSLATRTVSSPAVLPRPISPPYPFPMEQPVRSPTTSRFLLKNASNKPPQPTKAVVSETYLLAGANGHPASRPPIISECGRIYPLYCFDEADPFSTVPSEPVPSGRLRTFQQSLQNLMLVSDLGGPTAWLHRDEPGNGGGIGSHDAERRLRDILARYHLQQAAHEAEAQDELYD